MPPTRQPPVDVDPDRLTFDQEVELTIAAAGLDEPTAEFAVALRRGEVDGDLEEVRP
jgi:hypothetical protein